MKLIIEIPEQMYLNAKADTLCGADILVKAIKNGIPLTESDDCVSREAVDDLIHHYKNDRDSQLSDLSDGIWELPSVQPKTSEQIIWERDTAIQQLKDLGYGLGEKPNREKHDEEVIKETVASIWGKPPYTEVLDEIKAELHATAEKYEDGVYYLREEWIDEIIDKYRGKQDEQGTD